MTRKQITVSVVLTTLLFIYLITHPERVEYPFNKHWILTLLVASMWGVLIPELIGMAYGIATIENEEAYNDE